MPLYFFHTETDSHVDDDEGMELVSPREARAEAAKIAGEMMRDAPEAIWNSGSWKVTGADASGSIHWQISVQAVSADPTAKS